MKQAIHWLCGRHGRPLAFVFGIILGLEIANALRISISPQVNPAYGRIEIRMLRT